MTTTLHLNMYERSYVKPSDMFLGSLGSGMYVPSQTDDTTFPVLTPLSVSELGSVCGISDSDSNVLSGGWGSWSDRVSLFVLISWRLHSVLTPLWRRHDVHTSLSSPTSWLWFVLRDYGVWGGVRLSLPSEGDSLDFGLCFTFESSWGRFCPRWRV